MPYSIAIFNYTQIYIDICIQKSCSFPVVKRALNNEFEFCTLQGKN